MFLEMWNYLRGYVTIEVSGFSIERFINMAAHRGIYIWDIMPSGGKVSMSMSVKGYKSLKGCTKKTKCKMRIVKKCGLPFLFFKYRKRKIFAFGIVFFVAALYLLSSFIWVVEINGNERISTSTLLSYCEEVGLKPGSFKYSLDTRELTSGFLTAFDDLSWIAVEIKGTRAIIELAETIEKPQVIDRDTPCDVVASSDGLITDVAVISGTPLVSPKDIVKKGDVLVSGMLTIRDGEEIVGYRYTHAKAEVNAKVWHEIHLVEDLVYTRKDYTGKTKKLYSFDLMKTKFNIINTGISYKNYDKITKIRPLTLGGDFALPVSLITTEILEYNPVLIERAFDGAKVILMEKLDGMLENMLLEGNIVILDKSVEFEQNGGKIFLNAVITVKTRIDEQVNVSPSELKELPQLPDETGEEYSYNFAG